MGLRTWYVSSQAERFVPGRRYRETRWLQKYGKGRHGRGVLRKNRWPMVGGADLLWAAAQLPPLRPHRLSQGVCRGSTCRRCTRGPDAQPDKELVDNWTWENLRERPPRKCAKGRGIRSASGSAPAPMRSTSRARCSLPMGAEMTDAKGHHHRQLRTPTRQVLDWYKRLAKNHARQASIAYDNASNNKELVLPAKAALIMNPPSALWRWRPRDKAGGSARQLWTFSSPKGPKGRFDPAGYYLLGHLELLEKHPGGKRACWSI